MLDTTGFQDKDSRKPEYRELYEKHDFITAYSLHTDLRIAKDGPELAIGAKKDGEQDWDIHGKAQLDFLISRGLKPEHTLLDFGCGTGRLACKAIPYLNDGNYVGIDISAEAIALCRKNNPDKRPIFIQGSGGMDVPAMPYHMIWSHSIYTHIPEEVIERIFSDLSKMAFGEYCFTYKHADIVRRSGLKQFQYNPAFFSALAGKYGMNAEALPHEWPAGQKTMRIFR
jgi:SAM-dependent methyltransferase